jgi:uncharacterized C2H2 Zn-finger protein
MYLYCKFMEIECDECSQKLNDNAELAIHQREQHQKAYCGVCKKEFSNQKDLIKHVKDTHGIIMPSNNHD